MRRLLALAAQSLGSLSHVAAARPGMPQLARRSCTADGQAHIAVRGVHQPGAEPAAHALERRLADLEGVEWAAVTAPLGRVVVAHDESVLTLDALVEAVSAVEQETGLAEKPFLSVEHPGDSTPIVRETALTAANVVGWGLAVGGRVARLPTLPMAVPTLAALVDTTPAVRGVLERRLGTRLTDTTLAWSGAVTQVLAQRPVGLLVDAAYRVSFLSAARARRQAWLRQMVELTGPADHRATPIAVPARPVPLPAGYIERYADRVSPTAVAAYAMTVATTRSPQRALAVLAAAIPSAARRARESFAAQVERASARSGVIVFDPQALRRLDRIDTVVLDSSALLTGNLAVQDVTPVDPAAPVAELVKHVYELVDLTRPQEPRESGGWLVEPLGRLPKGTPFAARQVAAAGRRGGAQVLALRHDGDLVALVTIAAEIDPMAEALVAAASAAGRVVIAGDRGRLAGPLSVEDVVPGGPSLLASVRQLQAEGHGVAVVAARSSAALAAADLGIGVPDPAGRLPWGAHAIASQGIGQAHLLIAAIPVARHVSLRALQLTAGATSLALALAVLGPAAGAPRRAALPVIASIAAALGLGTWHGLKLASRAPPTPADRTPWHAMPVDAALRLLGSSGVGLTDDSAARRRATHAPKAAPNGSGIAQTTAEELASPVTATLAASAGLSAILGATTDAALILGVLAANALIGTAQRTRTDRTMRALMHAAAGRVRLRRAGREREALAEELVPGDVIELDAGDAVPADCRILEADGLEIDESGLTGESQLVAKEAAATNAAAVADRTSMLYEGTVVAAGSGRALVVATGARTEVGRTLGLQSGIKRRSGVEERLRSLVRITLPISVAAGVVLLAETVRRGQPFAQAIGPAVNLTIAAVPEGLPFVATVAELAAARRLSSRGALVRRPTTLETLGRVEVLCFDKTGTLTEGRITLGYVAGSGSGARVDELTPELRAVVAAGLRASPPAEASQALPHPTDGAVHSGATRLGINAEDGVTSWERLQELPFEPGRSYHAALGRSGKRLLLSVKGAPEVILERCDSQLGEATDEPLDSAGRLRLQDEAHRLARLGYRVLAVAERAASDSGPLTDDRVQGLCFRGLIGLADPIRPTAAAAARQLRQAGVEIVMVTGDHPGTAEAIAAELGTLDGRRILTGPELDDLDDAELGKCAPEVGVFARVTPAQKVRIVEALRAAGRVVAVTGDGANDAPAIRLSDAGVALGARATPAAREAADLVVTDDRIETIIDAVLEGRAMWASVRDALAILVGGNLGEVGFTLGAALVSGRSVLGTRQLLLVNMLTDVLPAMAIAVRPPPGLTRQALAAEGPEASLGAALRRDIAVRATTTAAAATVAWLLARMTGTHRRAQTVGLAALVAAQLGQTLVMGWRSPLVLAAVLASLAALVAAIQIPGISQFFGCQPLGTGWIIALGCAAVATLAGALLTWGLPALRRSRPRPLA